MSNFYGQIQFKKSLKLRIDSIDIINVHKVILFKKKEKKKRAKENVLYVLEPYFGNRPFVIPSQ